MVIGEKRGAATENAERGPGLKPCSCQRIFGGLKAPASTQRLRSEGFDCGRKERTRRGRIGGRRGVSGEWRLVSGEKRGLWLRQEGADAERENWRKERRRQVRLRRTGRPAKQYGTQKARRISQSECGRSNTAGRREWRRAMEEGSREKMRKSSKSWGRRRRGSRRFRSGWSGSRCGG